MSARPLPRRPTGRPNPNLPPALAGWRDQARTRWQLLAPRERRMLVAGGLALLVLLVWSLLVQPAWRTLRDTPRQIDQLDGQLQQMNRLVAEARALKAIPPVAPEQAGTALTAATQRLGRGATLNLQGNRASVTLNGIEAEALRAWLGEVRGAARARVVELQLKRGAAPASGNSPAAASGNGYSGTVVLLLGDPA